MFRSHSFDFLGPYAYLPTAALGKRFAHPVGQRFGTFELRIVLHTPGCAFWLVGASARFAHPVGVRFGLLSCGAFCIPHGPAVWQV